MRQKEMTEAQALEKLKALCARSEHASGDMLTKMREWDIAEDAQARIMSKLISERYIDDERFSRLYIEDKMKYNQWGRRKIEQGLCLKRVDQSVYAPLLNAVSSDDFADILRPLLKAKQRQVKAATPYEQRIKLIRFAMSRGFEMSEINKCLGNTDTDDDF